MKQINALSFLIVILQCCSIFNVAGQNVNLACEVEKTATFKFNEEDAHHVVVFITSDDPIKLQISFVGLPASKYNDLLTLKPESVEVVRDRNNNDETETATLLQSIPFGWNNITVTMREKILHIGEFYTHTEIENDINEISITSRFLTKCSESTPVWYMSQSSDVSIPLNGLSRIEVILASNHSFDPEIILNDLLIPLSYEEGLFIRRTNKLFPKNHYRIGITNQNQVISLFTISVNEEYELLMKIKLKEELESLKVKAVKGNFYLILNPFLEYEFEINNTIIKRHHQLTKNQQETPTSETLEIERKCQSSSSTTWQVTTVLFAVIAVGSIIANYYQYSRNNKQKYQEFGMEEGENLLGKQSKVSAKDKIKSEKTETHGEFNPKFGYQKQICKLKLKTDQTCKYKKTLGELDVTKQTKVVLAVGETGSGKSSVINAMANCIYGIKYEDPFRFKLVDDMDKSRTVGINTTEEITSYYIPYTPGIVNASNYIFIDTPGFGDLRGIDEDTKLVTKFKEFLKKNTDITEVDAICFVIKASDTRLTKIQKYIINGLLSMFGKDVMRNIFVVVSFFDGTETHVSKLLKDTGLEFDSEIHFDSNGIYNDSKGMEDLADTDIQDDFKENWNVTMSDMDRFFSILKRKTSVSLILTNMVLEENKDFTKLMDELLQLIEKEKFTSDEEKLKIEAKIEQNQNLLLIKLEEAKKLNGRLKNIPCKENPLAINDYIDVLIIREKDGNKKEKLERLKNRNTVFYDLLKEKESNSFNIMKHLLGEKYEKMD